MTAIPNNVTPQVNVNGEFENLDKNINALLNATPTNNTDILVEDMIGTPMIDFFSEAEKDIDEFDDFAWQTGEGYKAPSYPIVSEKLEGFSQGLYLFAGASNHGKSAMMMNLMYDLCQNPENNLFGIYFSLDDSKNEIIPRIVAMDQRIPISVVSKPARYKNFIDAVDANGTTDNEQNIAKVLQFEEYLEKRRDGLSNLRNNANKFKIEDSTKCTNLDDMKDYIIKAINYIKSIDENMNLIVAIDSINDVCLGSNHKASSNNERLDIVSREIKHWTVEFNIPILASTHLRKLNGNRRPTLDDMKDSIVLRYEASVIWLVYNEVSENKNAAKIYYANEEGDTVEKKPIIELDWAKNKKSSYKGRSFNYFSPEYSKAVECDENISLRYNALVYEA